MWSLATFHRAFLKSTPTPTATRISLIPVLGKSREFGSRLEDVYVEYVAFYNIL